MNKNRFMIASLLILIGMGAITVSCGKEKSCVRKAQMIVEDGCEKDGGDDDEDPVIMTRVKKKNTFVPVDSAYVETITYGTNITVSAKYTDMLGKCEHQVDTGTYYFKVTVRGNATPYVTDTMYVDKDKDVTILVD